MTKAQTKGLVHAALAVAGLIELFDSRSRPRKLLTGTVIGWHLQATVWHWLYEDRSKARRKALTALPRSVTVLNRKRKP